MSRRSMINGLETWWPTLRFWALALGGSGALVFGVVVWVVGGPWQRVAVIGTVATLCSWLAVVIAAVVAGRYIVLKLVTSGHPFGAPRSAFSKAAPLA